MADYLLVTWNVPLVAEALLMTVRMYEPETELEVKEKDVKFVYTITSWFSDALPI